MVGESATSAAAKGATYLMALQISSRALTFVLNQILLRFLTPEILGRAVQLELYSISVLFFARESLRVAVQRVGVPNPASTSTNAAKGADKKKGANGQNPSVGKAVQTAVNLSYISLVLGVPLLLGLGVLCHRVLVASSPGETTMAYGLFGAEDPNFSAVIVYGLATFCELAIEPGFAAAQSLLLYKVRAGAEAAGTVGKTFVTVGTALASHRLSLNLGVLPFAYGQLAFAFTLVIYYTFKITPIGKQTGFKLALAKIKNDQQYWLGYFSKPLLTIATSLSVQSAIKYVLTQGDSILIAALASLQDQGTYALAANYGGLVARMLFQPIEEASRNLFAKLCADTTSTDDAAVEGKKTATAGQKRAEEVIHAVVFVYILFLLPACWVIGPHLATPFLTLIAGSRWTDLGADRVLAAYVYYIPLLAANGVMEAFVSAVASTKELYRQSLWMGFFSALFAGSAWLFIAHWEVGARGIVWANCINMSCRILYCGRYINNYFESRGLKNSLLPHQASWKFFGVIAIAPSVIYGTEGFLSAYGVYGELLRLGFIGGITLSATILSELEFFKHCYAMVRGYSA